MVLWVVRPGVPPLSVAEFLEARPDVRVGLLLPERFFGEDGESWRARNILRELADQGRVEVLLSLPHRPVLALLHDSDLARLSTKAKGWPPRFHRPEDAVGQAALARSSSPLYPPCPPNRPGAQKGSVQLRLISVLISLAKVGMLQVWQATRSACRSSLSPW